MRPSVPAEPFATARIDLVPLRVDHAAEMAVVLGDPALHSFTGGAPSTPEALRARYERLVAGSPDPSISWCNWVLWVRDADRPAGTLQATVTGRDHAEIAWVVGTPGRAAASPPRRPQDSSAGYGLRACARSSPTSTPTTTRPRPWPAPPGCRPPRSGRTARCGGGWSSRREPCPAQEEERPTSSVASTTWRRSRPRDTAGRRSAISVRSRSSILRPISSMGWRTLVSGGSMCRAIAESS